MVQIRVDGEWMHPCEPVPTPPHFQLTHDSPALDHPDARMCTSTCRATHAPVSLELRAMAVCRRSSDRPLWPTVTVGAPACSAFGCSYVPSLTWMLQDCLSMALLLPRITRQPVRAPPGHTKPSSSYPHAPRLMRRDDCIPHRAQRHDLRRSERYASRVGPFHRGRSHAGQPRVGRDTACRTLSHVLPR